MLGAPVTPGKGVPAARNGRLGLAPSPSGPRCDTMVVRAYAVGGVMKRDGGERAPAPEADGPDDAVNTVVEESTAIAAASG